MEQVNVLTALTFSGRQIPSYATEHGKQCTYYRTAGHLAKDNHGNVSKHNSRENMLVFA